MNNSLLNYIFASLAALSVFAILTVGPWYFLYDTLIPISTDAVDLFLVPPFDTPFTSQQLIIYLGLTLAVCISLIIFLLLSTQQRAGTIAESMTKDLLSSRELFIKLYQSSPVPYVLLKNDETITFPNTAAARFFGVEKTQLTGTKLFDYISEEGLSEDEKQHISVLLTQYRRNVPIADEEVQIKRPDGTTRWALLSVFIDSKHGREHTGLATLTDITKQKEIERAKTEFVSLASHQLKTPISVLKWNLELLANPKSGTLTEQQQQYLKTIKAGTQRLDVIISDFLDVSRLELKTVKPEKESVNVDGLVQQILTELSTRAGHNQNVSADIRVDTIMTSKKYLRMVIENLLSNAMKYTPEGGSVSITAETSGGNVIFRVSDTGVGIPLDEQEEVFSKMFRASNVREEVPDGTGLGLYIVKLIVQTLGGEISFTSEPGKGTTFTISLPAR